MLATCFSTARSEITRVPAMAPFVLPSAIRERTSCSLGVRVSEVIGAPAGAQDVRDDFGVEGGAAGCHPAQRVDELADIADAVLEQVSDAGGTAAGCRSKELSGVARLNVLGENQHSGAGMVT